MDHVSEGFRRVCLPYCVQRCADGRWIVLNRRYKPVGWATTEWVDYETAAVPRLALTDQDLAALSCSGEVEGDQVHLYRDGSAPGQPGGHWPAYAARLSVLVAADKR